VLVAAAAAMAVPAASGSKRTLTLKEVDREPQAASESAADQVLADLKKAVEDTPDDRKARFLLVRALNKAGRNEEALAAAKAWREKDAYNLVVVRLIGDIYSELGDKQSALRTYSAVVELLPKDASAQRALASVLKQSGDFESARQRLAAAMKIRPEDRRLAFELADATQRTGDLAAARDLFESIASDEAAPPAVAYPAKQRLGQIYNEQRRAALQAKKTTDAASLAEKIAALKIKGGTVNDIKVYLTWDTDNSDVDLHVTNPDGETVNYQHREGKFGGALFDDVTTGYGPESFTAKQAASGKYEVKVNYYRAGSSNFSEARGELVVILNEGSDDENKHVIPYRLFEKGQTVTVARIDVR